MGWAQECTQANDAVIGIMAGPVKHLHYDGQPFRRLQEIAGVVARGPERLLASDEGGELAAARQSANSHTALAER